MSTLGSPVSNLVRFGRVFASLAFSSIEPLILCGSGLAELLA